MLACDEDGGITTFDVDVNNDGVRDFTFLADGKTRIRIGDLELFPGDDPCDFLIDERCILPYPSSRFLRADASTPTGLRVHYPADALPANTSGKHIDPTDWNTLDGFSPGPVILALFPDTGHAVDLDASGAPFHQ